MGRKGGGSWGIGHRRSKAKVYYDVMCEHCGKINTLTKRQYVEQSRFRCEKCKGMSKIIPSLSEKFRSRY